MNKEHHIPLIYNYCDRWCERCPMTARCQIYDPAADNKDWSDEENQKLWDEVAKNFEHTMEILKEEAEKNGMDWDKMVEEAKTIKLTEPVLNPLETETVQLAEKYRVEGMAWLSDNKNMDRIKSFADQLTKKLEMGIANSQKTVFRIENALGILFWYVTMIEPKLNRAIKGMHDGFEEDDPIQCDANGSAKVAIICINRSMGAWEKIRTEIPEMEDELLDHLATLSKLRKNMERIFPNYAAFIRPGFEIVDAIPILGTQNP